jgi:hypothetical protein
MLVDAPAILLVRLAWCSEDVPSGPAIAGIGVGRAVACEIGTGALGEHDRHQHTGQHGDRHQEPGGLIDPGAVADNPEPEQHATIAAATSQAPTTA